MRIVIEIDGEKVVSTALEESGAAAGPPPDVLQAAAARGAISAGRAPTGPDAARAIARRAPQDAGAARARAEVAERVQALSRPARRRTGSKTARARGSR